MKKITVLLADDHVIVREGIRSLLQSREEIEIIGEASNGLEAVKKAAELKPDIVIMDISMPILNGLEATRQIRELHLGSKVIILSMHENPESVKQSLKAGVAGYIIKKSAASDLFNAVFAVHGGDAYFSPSVSKMILEDYVDVTKGDNEILTARERQILQLVVEGHGNKEIADLLCISVKTVEGHKENIKKRLNVRDQIELVRYAIAKGMVSVDKV
jgi:DNA-binding NarL/FixJ family response regulator